MIEPNLRVTDRPWRENCATTGWTMQQFTDALDGVEAPDWVTRAAVSITRSYATCLTDGQYADYPVAELVMLIDSYRRGARHTDPELMRIYEIDKLEFEPQWPNEDPWVREVAVYICDRWTIRGLSDPGYIANVIHGEEIDADHPGQRHDRPRLIRQQYRDRS